MALEWLKDILGDSYTEEIDKKVSDEIGKNFVSRADFNNLNTEKKTLADTVKERDKQLETLKASAGDVEELKTQITNLQTENANAAKTHKAEIERIKIDTAVDLALSAAKAKNIKAVKALLELDKAELDADGSVKGLSDQIKKLAEASDSKFMFESEKPGGFSGLKPNEGGDPGVGGKLTFENFKKLSPTERFKFSQEHPEEYKNFYNGGTK